MKTRFKIAIVIACFVAFYFVLIPAFVACDEAGSDCTIWRELIGLTRPVVASEWLGEQVGWSGTTQEESTPLEDIAINNLPFVASMIVLPLVIIGFVVVWDKRK